MGIIHQLTRKPWLSGQVMIDDLHHGREFGLPTATFGLRVFLGVITVLFLLFFAAYSDRMSVSDWRPLPEPWLLWLNTAILILSGVAMQSALTGARRGEIDRVRRGLLYAGTSTVAFLIGQLFVWQQLVGLGYFAAENPANAFFYLLTALHGVHLLGGLVAWGRLAVRASRQVEAAPVLRSVELCALYWHFLLVVWLVLFTLLLVT